MSDIAAIVGAGTGRIEPVEVLTRPAPAPPVPPPSRTERPSDRVELSDRARLLHKLASLPPVRQDLIDRVKRQIAEGTYETPGRISGALDHLADDLDLIN